MIKINGELLVERVTHFLPDYIGDTLSNHGIDDDNLIAALVSLVRGAMEEELVSLEHEMELCGEEE